MFRFVLFVVLSLFLFTSCSPATGVPSDVPSEGEGPTEETWTVDLSEIGFNVVNFEPNADLRHNPDFNLQGRYSQDTCTVRYSPDLYEQPLQDGGDRFHFANAVLRCALDWEENGEMVTSIRESDMSFGAFYNAWLNRYDATCGESLYRLGWLSDPETDSDLSCVPGLEEGLLSNSESEGGEE